MAGRGLVSLALDLSQEMVAYGTEAAEKAGVALKFIQGDMRNFRLPQTVDLAAIFMDSTSYLLTNEDVLSHFKCVAASLNSGGLYILEMSHPRDVFSVGKSASTEWDAEEGDIRVSVKWGDDADSFDPIGQTKDVTARVRFKSLQGDGEISDRSLQRCFTFNEFDALVKASGCFEMMDVLGSLKPGVRFSNDKSCWRMIPVLRKLGFGS